MKVFFLLLNIQILLLWKKYDQANNFFVYYLFDVN